MKTFLLIIGVIIIAGGSFWGGTAYQKAHPAARSQFTGGQFTPGTGARAGANFTSGQIITEGSGSVTVKMSSGSTRIVLVSSATQVMKSASGTLNDLAVGTNVVVTGSTNADGSVTAQSVQIRPVGSPLPPTSTQ